MGNCGKRSATGSLISGLAIAVVGIVLLLGQFGYLDVQNLWHFWPVFFIISGIAKITSSNYTSPRIWGGFLILLGVILTMHEFGRFPVGLGHLWPLFIIVGGLLLMWQAYDARRNGEVSGEDDVTVFSVFGGSEQHINSQSFRGGQLFAIFGGYQIDLTQAEIEGTQAIIDATSIFGGGEIRIPRHWNVLVRGIGIFGGYGDETGKMPADMTKPPKTLIVKGVAMFGGVAVKN
jgi:predicted membrane protein